MPGFQAPGHEPSGVDGLRRPDDQPNGGDRSEGMKRQRFSQVTAQAGRDGSGEEAGGTGNAADRPKGATEPRQKGVKSLQAQVTGEQGRGQIARSLQPAQKNRPVPAKPSQRSTEPMITSIEPRMAMMSATLAPVRI